MSEGRGRIPKTVEDLADDVLERWRDFFDPVHRPAVRRLLITLYEHHPVMAKLAEEALVDSRIPPDASGPEQKAPAAILELRKRFGGG